MILNETNATFKRVAIIVQDDASRAIEFDATVLESHSTTAEATSYPVEGGANITDHIRSLPDSLTINGIVTDTPLIANPNDIRPIVDGGDVSNRAVDAYKFIRKIKEEGKLIRVITRLRDYRNMAIIGITVERDATRQLIVDMSIDFIEVLVATTELVEAPEPIAKPRKKPTDNGDKAKEDDPNKKDVKSLATDVVEGISRIGRGSGI